MILVDCPWPWCAYDLETGQCRTTARYRLGCYPVQERDGEFYADLPGPAPHRSWAERLRAHARGQDRPPGG